jgi:uncharacterized protein YjbJ (UPF0337 family)
LLEITEQPEQSKQMNWDQIEGKWKQFAGSARERWGQLTGRIQERYGIAMAEAEKQAEEWSRAQKQSEPASHLAGRL